MWKPLIRCSIVGGFVIFLWLTISWTVLPLHKMTMKNFTDSSEVSSTIMRYAPKDGVYVIPSKNEDIPKGSAPFIFVNIKRDVDFSSMTNAIIIGIITQIVGVFLVTYLLLKAKAMKYWYRVWFVTVAGLAIALLCSVPQWNWWHYPLNWTILEFLDRAIGWFIGALVIAKLVKK